MTGKASLQLARPLYSYLLIVVITASLQLVSSRLKLQQFLSRILQYRNWLLYTKLTSISVDKFSNSCSLHTVVSSQKCFFPCFSIDLKADQRCRSYMTYALQG
jgi:hypothetical protein